MKTLSFSGMRRQHGVILIVALLILIILSIMSVAMARSFGLSELKAGNVADKQRAFQAAQSAVTFGEWWLNQGTNATTTNCTGLTNADPTLGAAALVQICPATAIPVLTTLPLTVGANYVPPAMHVDAAGGTDSATGEINYRAKPQLYIRALGPNASGQQLFEVTGVGYGGASNTVAITQSVFAMGASTSSTSGTTTLGGL